MQKVIGNLVAQFGEYYKSLPPIKRNSILTATIIATLALSTVLIMVSGTNYKPLFTNVGPSQLPLIIDQLQKKNVPFTLKDDGRQVLIPEELLPATQMAIMSELGDTKVGNTGLELFAKQDFGVTTIQQRINFQRAMQGELMRAINTISSIKQSKVLLALPAKKTFLEESGKATASVVVDLYPGKNLTSDQVKGITYLVASSIEKLEAEDVTVINSRGKTLTKHYNPEMAASSELMEMKKKVEMDLENKIETILSKTVGTGKVIAKIEATLNPKHIRSVEELVDPDRTAVRSQTTEEEFLDGSRTNPAGVPGARANIPGAQDQGQVGFRQNVKKESKVLNYSVPKTVRNIRESAGGLQRVSVAVLVDEIEGRLKGENGEVTETWTQRSPEELKKFENIVKNAIGFNAARGDTVSIENIKFQKESFDEAQQIITVQEKRVLLRALFKWSLLGLSLVLFFFIVVRPFMRWVTDSFQDTVEDMLPRTIEELEELQSVDNTLPGMSGALPVLEESLDPDKAESELLKERIMSILNEDLEKTTAAFNLWLARRDL